MLMFFSKMWGVLTGSKLAMGGIVVGLVIVIAFTLQIRALKADLKTAHEQTGKWQQAVVDRDTLITGRDAALNEWQTRWAEEARARAAVDAMLVERENAIEGLTLAAARLDQSVDRLEDEDENIAEYLRRPMPDALFDCLRGRGTEQPATTSPATSCAHD